MIDPIQETIICDNNALYYGYPLEKLMENAGKGVAETISKKFGANKKIAFFCGPGNNGGDGMVAARHLQKNNQVTVFLIPPKPRSDLARKNWERFSGEKYADISAKDIPRDFDLVVECLFGTGISKKLEQPYKSIVKKLNQLKGTKISVDLPAPGFKEDLIISLMTRKDPQAVVVDIGYPDWLEKKVGIGEIKALKKPDKNSKKGDNGRVLIVAGSEKYHGALLLSAKMASKVADLIFVSSTPNNLEMIEKIKPKLPDFITIKEEELKKYCAEADVILVGPGLGTGEQARKKLDQILSWTKNKKIVLDADALKLVNKNKLHSKCLLTPHSREFKDLFGLKANQSNLKKMAQKYQCSILLKGEKDIISNGQKLKINKTGNPGLTKGGTGDVLAGLAAGLAGRNDLFLSACAAAFANGLAGDRLEKKNSFYYNASDLVKEVPRTLRWCKKY